MRLPSASRVPSRTSVDSDPREPATSPLGAQFRKLARRAGALTVVVGVLVLLGWWREVPIFISLLRGWPVMLPNSALMFVAAGSAAVLLGPEQLPSCRRRLGRVLAAFVVWLSALTLAEYLAGWDLGVDRLLFHDLPASWSAYPGRPSAQTNLSFCMSASALLLLNTKTRRGHRPSEYLALSSIALALLALLGYVHDARPFYGLTAILAHTGMAAHTAATLVLLNLSILLARPGAGGVATLASEELGGFMARRLLIVTLGVLVAGIFLVMGRRIGLYDQTIASALLTFITMATLISWGMLTAASLNRSSAERRAAHARETVQRRYLETVIDQMPDGILLSNADGVVELQNRALLRLTSSSQVEKPRREVELDLDVRQISGEVLPAEELPLARVLTEQAARPGEEYLVGLPEGKLLPVLISAAPIKRQDGQSLGAVMVIQDISALKDLEKLRTEWSAMVAHDLRQPVATIDLCVELLRQLHDGLSSDTERQTLDRIKRSNRRLKRMISDLLDVSRLEANRLTLKCTSLDLEVLTREIIEQLKLGELRGRPVRLSVHGALAPVWADPDRVEQVLSNLLSNAVKYGSPETEIAVELTPQHESIEVVVENHGRGISPDELRHLFQRFSRGQRTPAAEIQGIGLGLYISKGLIEAQGGRIWAESTPFQLTRFHFTLPMATVAVAL